MTSPLQGLQQRSEAETLEYLGWASAQLMRFSDVPEQAHSAITAQALVDAGVQVWRHHSGTGHSFVYWPRKMSSPVQCFNPRQAASAIMKQEGWKEALGEEVDAAAAAGIDNTGCFPGYTFLRPEKEQQVLDGVADKLTALTRRKFTGAEVRGLGLRAVAETKRQRRQYSIWWPGRMAESEEPVHCAPSYTVGAQKLLAHPACRELSDALKLAGDAQHWSPESLKALPGGAVLAAGLDTRSLAPFISEAQEMHDNLTADAAQLEALLAQGSPGSKAAAGSSVGSAGRTRGGGSAAADAAQRKPIVAFRSALEACAADVSAWLKQQRQQDVLQRLQAVNQGRSKSYASQVLITA
ncbi:hypothetical protein OEZ85_013141 [Tetradesmus obliquus]|uniref:Uncharacterized protein n=1 Tax=Tetradesmus obliquus TaxID=3088 RepID=A0ABY8U8S7_TETOB|nr:hypothetical protein OEZ85_013141 [Tetradesmus obliquus]